MNLQLGFSEWSIISLSMFVSIFIGFFLQNWWLLKEQTGLRHSFTHSTDIGCFGSMSKSSLPGAKIEKLQNIKQRT